MSLSQTAWKGCGVLAIGFGAFGLAGAAIGGASYLSGTTPQERERAADRFANNAALLAVSSCVGLLARAALRFSRKSPFSEIDEEDELSHVVPLDGQDDARRIEDLRKRYQSVLRTWSTPVADRSPEPGQPLFQVDASRRRLQDALRAADRIGVAEAVLDLALAEKELAESLERLGRPSEAAAIRASASKRIWSVHLRLENLDSDGEA